MYVFIQIFIKFLIFAVFIFFRKSGFSEIKKKINYLQVKLVGTAINELILISQLWLIKD